MTKTTNTLSRRTLLMGTLGAAPIAATMALAATQARAGGDPDGKVIHNLRAGEPPIKGRKRPQGKG